MAAIHQDEVTPMKNLEVAFECLAIKGEVHPNFYTGSWAGVPRRSTDYAELLVERLEGLGLVRGRHFEAGNDAPHGGHTGSWVQLTPLGRRRKVFRDVRAAEEKRIEGLGPHAYIPGWSLPPLATVIRRWHRAGAVHPAPDEVVAAKRESGLTWKMIDNRA
jgi:hypothetical protein